MKRTTFFILAFTLLSCSIGAFAANDTNKEPIDIKDKPTPPNTGSIKPRTDISTVDAWYDYDSSMFEFWFNDDVGCVTIYVSDAMNQTVASCTCDTSIESMAYILFNIDIDTSYAIQIIGNDYYGEGYLL